MVAVAVVEVEVEAGPVITAVVGVVVVVVVTGEEDGGEVALPVSQLVPVKPTLQLQV